MFVWYLPFGTTWIYHLLSLGKYFLMRGKYNMDTLIILIIMFASCLLDRGISANTTVLKLHQWCKFDSAVAGFIKGIAQSEHHWCKF